MRLSALELGRGLYSSATIRAVAAGISTTGDKSMAAIGRQSGQIGALHAPAPLLFTGKR